MFIVLFGWLGCAVGLLLGVILHNGGLISSVNTAGAGAVLLTLTLGLIGFLAGIGYGIHLQQQFWNQNPQKKHSTIPAYVFLAIVAVVVLNPTIILGLFFK